MQEDKIVRSMMKTATKGELAPLLGRKICAGWENFAA